ncbi:MAG: hypothetical protein Q7R89_04185 [bacterium]|nr:hypothetical protein [bacterium]
MMKLILSTPVIIAIVVFVIFHLLSNRLKKNGSKIAIDKPIFGYVAIVALIIFLFWFFVFIIGPIGASLGG